MSFERLNRKLVKKGIIQRLVKMGYARNASQLVNQVLAEAPAKLEGSNMPQNLAYEAPRKKHLSLLREIKSLEKEITDYGSDYQALIELAKIPDLTSNSYQTVEAIIPNRTVNLLANVLKRFASPSSTLTPITSEEDHLQLKFEECLILEKTSNINECASSRNRGKTRGHSQKTQRVGFENCAAQCRQKI